MDGTPAYKNFSLNIDRLLELFQLIDAQIEATNREVIPQLKDDLSSAKEKDDVYGMGAALGKYLSIKAAANFQFQWYAVMLVTLTEAYLQDVLSYFASIDEKLMNDSDQKASYQEIMAADSIDNLAQELRERWARNFIDKGGPKVWIKRLYRSGARGYADGLAEKMECLWGIRHVVVHRAGKVSTDFVRRHSELGFSRGDEIKLDGDQITSYAISVIEFVKTTDKYFCFRYKSQSEKSDDVPVPGE
jgi:hypothetical protein